MKILFAYVWVHMRESNNSGYVHARACSVKSSTNPAIWFSHNMPPKQSGPWQQLIEPLKKEEQEERAGKAGSRLWQKKGTFLTWKQLHYHQAIQTTNTHTFP